jgi:hypothetical protein
MDANERMGYEDISVKGFNKKIVDLFPVKGEVFLEFRNKETGKVRKYRSDNVVTNGGLTTIADRVSGGADTLPTHMAVGETSGGKTAASTTLEAEVAASRTALTSTTQGSGGNANKVTWVCTFAAAVGTGALKEAGIFNNAAGGTMFCYVEFGTLTKEAADELTVTWVLTCGTWV